MAAINSRPLNMTNISPNKQSGLHDIDGGDSTNTIQHVRKRDKARKFLGILKSKTKDLKNNASNQSLNADRTPQATSFSLLASQATGPPIIASQPEGANSDDSRSASSSLPAETLLLTPPPTATKRLSDVFTENLPKPSLGTDLPNLMERIEKTEQLVYCNTLLLKASSLMTTADAGEGPISTTITTIALQMKPTFTDKEIKWLTEMDKNPVEKTHIRWLATRMVEEFIQDPSKDSVKIAEVVALGPVLDREPYRKLLSSIIGGFEDARILDTDLLQGLVQLVQSASPGFLMSDDLVKILSVLRIRLQGTHLQSSEHSFHLALAVSRVLDAMAEHEVKGLNRVEEHEPLSGVLSGLEGSSDPYLMYQACYAFQALQYMPDDETALQAVFRHSLGVIDGLVKVSAVFKLDLGTVLEGLRKLHETLDGVIGTASTVYEGVCTVMESGQGVFESMKEGLGSGKKRPWYASIRAAYALVQAGHLRDLNQLIYEAPCRHDPLFQWGICQLLGEIAFDAIWISTARQQAVDLLGELYRNDPVWGQDESVKTWMLNVINQLSLVDDQTVSTRAHTLSKEMKPDQDTTIAFPYSLQSQLPRPKSSPILSRVHNIPVVEYHLYQLQAQRLKQRQQAVYIPPLAKASRKTNDDDVFPLMERVLEFLSDKRQVMLVLGDSGAGKSTFNRHLEHLLWTDYKQGDPIPLFINLPAIDRPDQDLIAKQLKIYNFKDDQVQEIKQHHRLILICDGYDESQQLVNLHHTNMLNQPGQWNTKMIINCRTQFLGPTYLDRFKPQSNDLYASSQQSLFQEAIIAPFSKEQIENYVGQYVPLEPRAWRTQDYMDRLTTIPNLLDLVRNPFLLTLALEALPGVTEGKKDLSKVKITRVQLYDTFVHHWFEVNQRRLERNNALSSDDRVMLVRLVNADFVSLGITFSSKLAQAIFDKQDGNPVVKYVEFNDEDTWKTEFFGTQPKVRLLRESSPLTRTGNQFRFIHRSMLEYFLSCFIYNPARIDNQGCGPQTDPVSCAATFIDANGPLFRRDLLKEPSIIQFLCDRVKLNPEFEQALRRVINLSKTDSSVTTAATHAITILVKAGVHFHGADLRGVKIPGADLSDGQFDSAQLQGADLTNVILSRSWLRQADLSGARLKGVCFGEQPYLDARGAVKSCTYSPDGKMLAVGFWRHSTRIYDTSTGTVTRRLGEVRDVAFSSHSQEIVTADLDGSVPKLNYTSDGNLVMSGRSKGVRSVAFSPCGKQIASTSDYGTVRLCDSQTGERAFVLEGHTFPVTCVKYSPDGCELVSGSEDETIRFWNPLTGEAGAVLNASLGKIVCLAYSPDGRLITSGHRRGLLQLWNAVTKKPGSVLNGHSASVTGVTFSPDGHRIASSSDDETVRLWDADSGTLLSVWIGHGSSVECVAFSPDGLQVASGGSDKKVRLWEVGSALSSLDPRDDDRVNEIAYASNGRTILAQSFCHFFRKWDAVTGASSEPISLEFAEPQAVLCMAFTPDGSQFAVGYKNGSIHLRNCQTSTAGLILVGHSSEVRMLVYSPCLRRIASVDKNNIVRLWDLHNTEQHRVLVEIDRDLEESVCVMVFSPTGDQLAVGFWLGTVSLFDLSSMELLSSNKLSDSNVVSMVYSPNGRQIAIGAMEKCIYLWDLQSKKPGAKLSGHRGWVRCIAYSPCGQWIISGCDGKMVEIWRRQLMGEAESWSRVHSIYSFFDRVINISWNPAVPMEFVTSCRDGSIRVWRLLSDENGNVVVQMLWGSNIGIFCANGLTLDNVTNLSPVNKKLLLQRRAVPPITNHEEQE